MRIQTIPSGSRPFAGSSNMRTCGSPKSAAAIPSRWLIPERERAHSPAGDVAEPYQFEHLVDAATRNAVRLRQAQQVLAGAAATVHSFGVEQRPDLVEREAVIGVRLPGDRDAPLVRTVQTEDESHCRGLPSAVRSEEPGDTPGLHRKTESIDRKRCSVTLRETPRLDHRHRERLRTGAHARHVDMPTVFIGCLSGSGPRGREPSDRFLRVPCGFNAEPLCHHPYCAPSTNAIWS